MACGEAQKLEIVVQEVGTLEQEVGRVAQEACSETQEMGRVVQEVGTVEQEMGRVQEVCSEAQAVGSNV